METRVDVIWLVAAAALFVAGGFAAQRLAFWATRAFFAFIIAAPGGDGRQRLKIQAIRARRRRRPHPRVSRSAASARSCSFPGRRCSGRSSWCCFSARSRCGLAVALGRVMIAPGARHLHFRVLPLSTPLAWFWYRWLVWTNGLIVGGVAILASCASSASRERPSRVVAAGWLTLVAIGFLVLIWRRQHFPDAPQLPRVAALGLSFAVVLAWFFGSLGMTALFVTLVSVAALRAFDRRGQ